MDGYAPLGVLGSGSFGVIRRVRRCCDSKVLARKEIDYRRMSEREKRQLVAEVNILRELKHPNIVRYYERFVDRQNCLIYIIMEFCEGGDLSAVIRRCRRDGRHVPEDIVWNLLSQLLLALHECHRSDTHPTVLHRDIKPENVFLDKSLNIKLGDFGLSRIIEDPEVEFAKTFVGTPFYMSPELIDESRYNTKSDIWALGCLIYELCALEPPFQANTQPVLASKIRLGAITPLPSHYSSDLYQIIRSMLTLNYEKRPSSQDLLTHYRIRLSLREQELAEGLAELKRRESELERRLAQVEQREQELAAREEEMQELTVRLKSHGDLRTEECHYNTLPNTPSAARLTHASHARRLLRSAANENQPPHVFSSPNSSATLSKTPPASGRPTMLDRPAAPRTVSRIRMANGERGGSSDTGARHHHHLHDSPATTDSVYDDVAIVPSASPTALHSHTHTSGGSQTPSPAGLRLRGRIGAFRARAGSLTPSAPKSVHSGATMIDSGTTISR